MSPEIPIAPHALRPQILPASSSSQMRDAAGDPFGNLLLQTIEKTNATELNAQGAIAKSLMGEDITQVEVLTAVKKADLSLRLLLQIRNKVLEAFNEVKQMQM